MQTNREEMVSGDVDRRATRVGTSIDGLGQMFTCPEEVRALGAEVGIFEHLAEYTRIYATELGLSIIEAGHSTTEMPDLENLVRVIKDNMGPCK